MLSCVQLCNLWIIAHQAPLSMEFSRHEYWSGFPFPSPGNSPNPGMKPRSPALQADCLPSEPPGKPKFMSTTLLSWLINCQYRKSIYNPWNCVPESIIHHSKLAHPTKDVFFFLVIDGITNSRDMSLGKLYDTVKEREAWRAVVHGVAKSWTWLSNWTIAIIISPLLFLLMIKVLVKLKRTHVPWSGWSISLSKSNFTWVSLA